MMEEAMNITRTVERTIRNGRLRTKKSRYGHKTMYYNKSFSTNIGPIIQIFRVGSFWDTTGS